MAAVKKPLDTFVVPLVETILLFLRKISYFYWVECFLKWRLKGKYKTFGFFFVDVWVIFFLFLSITCYALSFCIQEFYFQTFLIMFSTLRVFEYVVYLLWVLLFARKNKGQADVRSFQRLLILIIFNYIETIFWFATWYSILLDRGSLKLLSPESPHPIVILRESITLMVVNWSGNFTKLSTSAWMVVTAQDVIGLLLTIGIVARVISLLPKLSSSTGK
jgi:hypothetical protein